PNLSAPGFSASLCRERTGCPGRPPPDRTPTLPGRSSLSADAPVLSPWPAAFPRSCARQKYTVLLDSLTWCRLRIPSGGLSRPWPQVSPPAGKTALPAHPGTALRSEEHTSELQSRFDLVCRLLLEKKKKVHDHNMN